MEWTFLIFNEEDEELAHEDETDRVHQLPLRE